MKVIIRIDEDAAIRAGRNVFGEQIIELNPAELTPDQRESLCQCGSTEGIKNLAKIASGGLWSGINSIEASPEAALKILDKITAERNEKKAREAAEKKKIAAKEEKERKEFLSRGVEGNIRRTESTRPTSVDAILKYVWAHEWYLPVTHFPDSPATLALKTQIQEEILRRNAEETKKAKAEALEKHEKELAEKERKAAFIARIVTEHCSDSQKKRFSEGLLPKKELEQVMEDIAFSCLADFPRYRPIDKGDLARDLDIEYAEEEEIELVEFSVNPATEVDEEEYAALEKIREALKAVYPDATATVFTHRATLHDEVVCEAASIRCRVKLGEFFIFERDYAIRDKAV